MSLAPSIAVPRASFNPLPLYIGAFCLLWSFAFVAGKIGVTDCPPLILLTARFSLAGILILGISALRGDAWSLSWRDVVCLCGCSASPTTRSISASAIPGCRRCRPVSAV